MDHHDVVRDLAKTDGYAVNDAARLITEWSHVLRNIAYSDPNVPAGDVCRLAAQALGIPGPD